jgi:signal peptidase I
MRIVLAILTFSVVAVLAQAQDLTVFQRGDLVRMKSQSPSYALRVIAVPGDRVRMDKSAIYVNDAAVTGLSSDLVANNSGGTKTIPANHYYVVGEQRVKSEDGESLSQNYSFIWAGSIEKVR